MWKKFVSSLNAAKLQRTADEVTTELRKFGLAAPSPQGTVDIFKDRWASDFGEAIPNVKAGRHTLFTADPRPGFAVDSFGGLEGMRVLELGPLEGGHTYQLEKFGAREIVAVEGNVEAYLKCLISKELIGMKAARFLFGDFVEYLRTSEERFDIIFCCGVLYHVQNPIDLIELIAKHTDRIFIWTHFEALPSSRPVRVVQSHGNSYRLYIHENVNRDFGHYWGGNRPSSSWLTREDILKSFASVGLLLRRICAEEFDHPSGPNFSATFERPAAP